MKTYQNYIFDLYGTLVDIHTDEEDAKLWEKLALFYGYYGADYTAEGLKEAYQELIAKEKTTGTYAYEAYPEIELEDIFLKLFTRKGVAEDKELAVHAGQFFRALSTEYIKTYDGAIKMLKKLRENGKTLYLLTNAQRIFTAFEIKYLGLEECFDGILISSECHCKKPDRKFFDILTTKYNLDEKDCIMIGNDNNTDIAGANAVGMDSYYIHSNLSPELSGDSDATYQCDDMAKLYEELVK